MERLEKKKVNGRTYYYYSKWEWVDGRCRRVWQKYLGKLENIVKAVDGEGPSPLYAEVFQWGLPLAMWSECRRSEVVEHVDELCPKRSQGLSTGQYLAIAAINRAICAKSKRGMWEWFSQTALMRLLPNASNASLSSQRFWDHMDRIGADETEAIWKRILRGVREREDIDLSSISYDGTNYYSFIDTFNTRCQVAKRGKNKQGRNNLRQVSYALFCSADGHMPLYYDVYDGNRNDAKQFPRVLEKFHSFLGEISGDLKKTPETTLIFDKGNNSADNFALIDSMNLHFVGSVKLGEHKELMQVSNNDPRFVTNSAELFEDVKSFRVKAEVYGKKRTLVVTYNQKLFDSQWLTVNNDIEKTLEKLAALQKKLNDRAEVIVTRGKSPTNVSVEKQCKSILSRQHMKDVIKINIQSTENLPRLSYELDTAALNKLADTHLGKTIIVTSRDNWDDASIIQAYRSQFIIENVFKETKDRRTGTWWPMHHWTDSKIRVHGLYCTIALMLRAVALRRAEQAGVKISMGRFLSELDDIREVINIYPSTRGQKKHRTQAVLTKPSEIQARLMDALSLEQNEFSPQLG